MSQYCTTAIRLLWMLMSANVWNVLNCGGLFIMNTLFLMHLVVIFKWESLFLLSVCILLGWYCLYCFDTVGWMAERAIPACKKLSDTVKWSNWVYLFASASLLWELTCHLGLHSVTHHLAEVTFPPLPQPIKAGTRCSNPRGMQGWVDLVGLVGCWHDYLPGARCRFAYGPADATATHCLLLQ